MKELNKFREFLQENEVHEGTWSVGSPQSRDKLAQMLTNVQMKNDSVEDMLQAFKVAKKYAYAVAGSDDVFDYLDAAEAELEKGEEGFDPDHFSDHITDAILAVSRLQENDKALDEVIEETVFDDIDSNLDLIATHMSADETLKELVSELQIVGGTKALDHALRNIVRDNGLVGGFEESVNDKALNETLNEGFFTALSDAIKTGIAKQLFRIIPDDPEVVYLYLQQAKEEGVDDEFIVEYLEFMSSISFRPKIAAKAAEVLEKIK